MYFVIHFCNAIFTYFMLYLGSLIIICTTFNLYFVCRYVFIFELVRTVNNKVINFVINVYSRTFYNKIIMFKFIYVDYVILFTAFLQQMRVFFLTLFLNLFLAVVFMLCHRSNFFLLSSYIYCLRLVLMFAHLQFLNRLHLCASFLSMLSFCIVVL